MTDTADGSERPQPALDLESEVVREAIAEITDTLQDLSEKHGGNYS